MKTAFKKFFTLVELIIVIAIISILAVVAFLIVIKWIGQSRDTRRLSDLKLLSKSIEISTLGEGKITYPTPDDYDNIRDDRTALLWKQGKYGIDVKTNVDSINKIPSDPLNNELYDYSVSFDNRQFQVETELENGQIVQEQVKLDGKFNNCIVAALSGAYEMRMLPSMFIQSGTTLNSGTNYIYEQNSSTSNTKSIYPVTVTDLYDSNLGNDNEILENIVSTYSGDGITDTKLAANQISKCAGGTKVDSNIAASAAVESANNLILNVVNNIGNTKFEMFYDVTIDGDNYIAVGFSKSDLNLLTGGSSNLGDSDFVIAKFNSNLELLKIVNFGGTQQDEFISIVKDGNYYVAVGYTSSNLSAYTGGSASIGSDFVIAKFDQDLNIIKINNFGGTSDDLFKDIGHYDSYYSIAGYSFSDLSALTGGSPNGGGGESDMVIATMDSDLNLIKLNNVGSSSPEFAVKITKYNGKYYLAGNTWGNMSALNGGGPGYGNWDFMIAKFDNDLNFEKIVNFGGNGSDNINGIIVSNGNIIGVGDSTSNLNAYTGGSVSLGGADFVVIKADENLNLKMVKNFGGNSWDGLYNIENYGSYLLTAGYTMSDLSAYPGGKISNGSDFAAIKLDNDLNVTKVNQIGGSNSEFVGNCVKNDDFYVGVGFSDSDLTAYAGGKVGSGDSDMLILKFE